MQYLCVHVNHFNTDKYTLARIPMQFVILVQISNQDWVNGCFATINCSLTKKNLNKFQLALQSLIFLFITRNISFILHVWIAYHRISLFLFILILYTINPTA